MSTSRRCPSRSRRIDCSTTPKSRMSGRTFDDYNVRQYPTKSLWVDFAGRLCRYQWPILIGRRAGRCGYFLVDAEPVGWPPNRTGWPLLRGRRAGRGGPRDRRAGRGGHF